MWLSIAAAAGLIAVVALASRATSVGPSAMHLDLGIVLATIEVVAYVALIVGLVFGVPAMLVYRAKRRLLVVREEERQFVPWWSRAGSVVLSLTILAIQVVTLIYLADLLRPPGPGAADGQPDPAAGVDPNALGAGGDATSLVIALVIVTFLALGILAYAIRSRLSDAALPPDGDVQRSGMTAQAVEVSLDALRQEPDPRRAIIAAYAAMEGSMSRAGLGRRPSEAPIEYLRRMLAGAMADADDVRTLTHLFEVAKFSHHDVDEGMRAGAIGALDRIRSATIGRA